MKKHKRRARSGQDRMSHGRPSGQAGATKPGGVEAGAGGHAPLDGEILDRDPDFEAAFADLVKGAPPLMRERLCNPRLDDPDEIRTYRLACLGLRSLMRDADDVQWTLLREQALEDVEKERARRAKTLLVRHTRPEALNALLRFVDPSSSLDVPASAILAGDANRLERAQEALALAGLSLVDVQDMAVHQCLADLQALDLLQHGPDLRQRRSRELMMQRQADRFLSGGVSFQTRPRESSGADNGPASPPAQVRSETIVDTTAEPPRGSSAARAETPAAPAADRHDPAIAIAATADVLSESTPHAPAAGDNLTRTGMGTGHDERSEARTAPAAQACETQPASGEGSSDGR